MNTFAEDLNPIIKNNSPAVYAMLSFMGQDLFCPKGILSQTAEAKQKATFFNATIDITNADDHLMYLPGVKTVFKDLGPDAILPCAPALGLSLPAVTSGLTHGLSVAADLFVDPGDVVLLPDMAWGNYTMIFVVRHGARIERFPLFIPGQYDSVRVEDETMLSIKDSPREQQDYLICDGYNESRGFNGTDFCRTLLSVADRGKVVVILNFPNNPTGYCLTKIEALAAVGALKEVTK